LWISKLWNLGRNTGAKLSFYADEAMLDILRQIQRIHPVDGDFHLFEDWNEFPSLAKEVGKDERCLS